MALLLRTHTQHTNSYAKSTCTKRTTFERGKRVTDFYNEHYERSVHFDLSSCGRISRERESRKGDTERMKEGAQRDTTSKSTTIFNCTVIIVCYLLRAISPQKKSLSNDLFELKIVWPSCWRLRSVGVLWSAFGEGPHVRASLFLSSSTVDTNGHKHSYRLPSLLFRFENLSTRHQHAHTLILATGKIIKRNKATHQTLSTRKEMGMKSVNKQV